MTKEGLETEKPKPKKTRIKVTTETIRMRMSVARKDSIFFAENDRRFGIEDAASMFGISKQMFWSFSSNNPDYATKPSKKMCPVCSSSMYGRISNWINDGSLDHLLKKKKKMEVNNKGGEQK